VPSAYNNNCKLVVIFSFNWKISWQKKKKNNQTHNNILIKKKELQKKFNIKIDYLEIRNEKNLTSLIKNKKIRLFVAYYINKVRLIDNF